ncbi:1-aminocyclopropane-1-carboxylate deaminase/D-cysteine desulfhydrase [Rheinheimera sp. NSM]|uniref:1-aminocyclopropane-1-carboxylate deaminase/D-cysteine desulfhydrase n=1 Tax=Rheinheimera sp. NSM TaxID=3457884 RepID=UPI0040370B50
MLYSSEIQLPAARQRWQPLSHTLLLRHQVQLWICHLETDLAEVSGNKWLKLKYHLAAAQHEGMAGVFTFGGAFSNHLCAVAAACRQLGLTSMAYVRADKPDPANPTLRFCQQQGMQLHFVDRNSYRLRHQSDFIRRLQQQHPRLLMVPEGGSSADGARGVAGLDLATTPDGPADTIICATASGGTLAGIISRNDAAVLGIAVVKDPSLPDKVLQLLPAQQSLSRWQINTDFTGAGYGRFSPELLQFCRDMAQQRLYVEPVYTGKALNGLFSLIAAGYFPAGSRLSFFHTGGLQGLKGMHYRGLITAADLALLSGLTAG